MDKILVKGRPDMTSVSVMATDKLVKHSIAHRHQVGVVRSALLKLATGSVKPARIALSLSVK